MAVRDRVSQEWLTYFTVSGGRGGRAAPPTLFPTTVGNYPKRKKERIERNTVLKSKGMSANGNTARSGSSL